VRAVEHIDASRISAGSPLAETAARITELDKYRSFHVGIPEGEGWMRSTQLTDVGFASAWFQRVAEKIGDRRFAGAAVSRSYVSSVVLTWGFPVFAEARLPLCSFQGAALRLGDRNRVVAVAVEDERVAVLDGDPAAGRPGTVILKSRDELWDSLVEKLLAVGPLLEVVHQVSGLGWPALWGEVADQIASSALWLAQLYERDRWAAWQDGMNVIDRLAAREPRLKVRPRPFPVRWSGGEELHMVRGTCCLHYRKGKATHSGEELYCVSCPIRSDDWRAERLRAQLEGEASR